MSILVGVDNYSFHRLLGETRPGESPSSDSPWDWKDTIRFAEVSGADVIALETCFISGPDEVIHYRGYRRPQLMVSWGHPNGLEYGTSTNAENDLLAWMRIAAELESRRMRIVIAHPALREKLWTPSTRRRTIESLKRVAASARTFDLHLAIENHADLTARELVDLLDAVGAENLEVCFDLANASRVGDDPIDAARVLAPHVSVMHVKDVDLTRSYGLAGPPSVKLGTGSLPVRQAVKVVTEARPDVWLLVELAQIEDSALSEEEWVTRDIAWIRSHL